MIRLRASCLLLALTAVPALPAGEPRLDAAGDPLPVGAVARLGTLRWRADSTISYAAFLPGDRELLTVSQDFVASVWDVATGRELRRFDVGGKAIPVVPPGRLPPVLSFGFARLRADGKSLVSADRELSVRVWNVVTGSEMFALPRSMRISSRAALSADGNLLADISTDGNLHLSEIAPNAPLQPKSFPPNRIQAYHYVFGSNGRTLLHFGIEMVPQPGKQQQGSARPVVIFWDVATGKEQHRLIDLLPPGNVDDVHFGLSRGTVSPDARRLALAMSNGVALLDLESGKEIGQRREFGDRMQLSLLFSPDSKTLIGTSGPGNAVAIWNAADGTLRKQFGTPITPLPAGGMPWTVPDRSARNLCLSSDARTLAWTEGAAIHLTEMETGRLQSAPTGHSAGVKDVQFAPDGHSVFTISSEPAVMVWDAAAGTIRRLIAVPRQNLSQMISADGRLLVTSDNNAFSAHVLNAASGTELRKITWDSDGFNSTFRLSPDTKTLVVVAINRASAHGGVAQVYDADTGKKVCDLPLPPTPSARPESTEAVYYRSARRILFTPDSRLMAVSTEGHLTVWDLARRRELQRIEFPAGAVLRHAALSPDGRTAAIEFLGGDVGMWELTTGQRRRSMPTGAPAGRAFTPPIHLRRLFEGIFYNTTLAYSPDGRLLANADAEGVIRCWDADTGRKVGAFSGHRGPIISLAFSPDGRRLVSGSTDTTALVWDVAPLRDRLATPTASLSPARLGELWATLLDADASKAYTAITEMVSDPSHSVALLKDKAQPVVPPDPKIVASLVAALGDRSFAAREKARQELERFGELIEPALRDAAANAPSADARQLAKRLLDRLSQVPPADQLRLLRAIETLEMIGSPEAVAVLKKLAQGAKESAVTAAATAALQRVPRKN